MAVSPNYLQRRVINYFVRRNLQGWGRPLAFTMQRLRLGGMLLGGGIVVAVIDGLVNGPNAALHLQTGSAVALGLIVVLSFIACAGFWLRAIPQFYLARTQPVQEHTGTVNAVICDVQSIAPFVKEHFITLREGNNQLRAFAIPPELHDTVCVPGKHLTLTVIPGIDYVMAAK